MVLETERLLLRRFKSDDLMDFYEYCKNPNVGPNAGWLPHANIDISKVILDEFVNDDKIFAIVYKKNNKVIGSVGLHPDRKRNNSRAIMLGYVLSEDYWGRGIMTEACRETLRYVFMELDKDMITIYHYEFNNRSRRVIEKLGFTFEGILRKASVLPSGVHDDYCYSLTKEEWEKNRL